MLGASLIQPEDAGYPRRLRDALPRYGRSLPALHVAGTIDDSGPAVAFVGARAASEEALGAAHDLAVRVAARGGTVVSGGALGIDGAAHRGALQGGGRTVAVLGSGIDIMYPERHRGLFASIVDRGGALVSMFAVGTPPLPANFVRRNRLIAGLVDLVVVVSAGARSGSLHTARAAVELGRGLAAVPGSPGAHALLAAGAARIDGPADLDDLLDGTSRASERRVLTGDEQRVLASLDTAQPRDATEVAAAAGLRLATAMMLLSDLEAAGWIVPLSGATYLRSAVPVA